MAGEMTIADQARRHERRRRRRRSSLDDLSVQEIDERITTLQAEITRLRGGAKSQTNILDAAAAFFKFGIRAEALEPGLPCLIPRFLCESRMSYRKRPI